MRKHLWSKLSAILIIMLYFVSPVWGGGNEIELESYVPLNMHFTIYHEGRPPIWRTGTLSGDGKIHHALTIRLRSGHPEESVIEPTEEEWKEFFNVVESANIWGLEKGSELLPTTRARVPIYWKLELEYPDRILKIEGWTVSTTTRVDVKGAKEVFGEQTLISKNLSIANEYENIQKIFYAIKKLLGEGISGNSHLAYFDSSSYLDLFCLIAYSWYRN